MRASAVNIVSFRYQNNQVVDRCRPTGSNPPVNTDDIAAARAALSAWGHESARLAPLGQGLINLTLRVTPARGPEFVLQRVNPVFPAAVNRDVDVVTRRLEEAGVGTARLVPTRSGALWVEYAAGVWRLQTWLPGLSREALAEPPQAEAAGRLLGRFHTALDGLAHAFANPRLGVHDTARHLQRLRDALEMHRSHRRYAQVAPLAAEILELAAALPALPPTADRIVHGDPKINNMLFDARSGEALCMVDLDTVGRMPLPLELGDAFRSWCNPAGENQRSGVFSAALFDAGLRGYAATAGAWITPAEQAAIAPATLTIIVELAARFCADALNENYFGWDAQRFASRSEHNQVRAAGQMSLARSCRSVYAQLQASVERAFA